MNFFEINLSIIIWMREACVCVVLVLVHCRTRASVTVTLQGFSYINSLSLSLSLSLSAVKGVVCELVFTVVYIPFKSNPGFNSRPSIIIVVRTYVNDKMGYRYAID